MSSHAWLPYLCFFRRLSRRTITTTCHNHFAATTRRHQQLAVRVRYFPSWTQVNGTSSLTQPKRSAPFLSCFAMSCRGPVTANLYRGDGGDDNAAGDDNHAASPHKPATRNLPSEPAVRPVPVAHDGAPVAAGVVCVCVCVCVHVFVCACMCACLRVFFSHQRRPHLTS